VSIRALSLASVVGAVCLILSGCTTTFVVSVTNRETGAPVTDARVRIVHTKDGVGHQSQLMRLDASGHAKETFFKGGALAGEGSQMMVTVVPAGESGDDGAAGQFVCDTPLNASERVQAMLLPLPTKGNWRAYFEKLDVWVERK